MIKFYVYGAVFTTAWLIAALVELLLAVPLF